MLLVLFQIISPCCISFKVLSTVLSLLSSGAPSQAGFNSLSVSCKRNSASMRKYLGIDTANKNIKTSPLQGPWNNNKNTSVMLAEAKRTTVLRE